MKNANEVRSIALCLENLSGPEQPTFLQCVALPGDRPGLELAADGGVHFQRRSGARNVELWVSADEHLMLLVPDGCRFDTRVERAGRSLVVPAQKPVVLRDKDRLVLGAGADKRAFRVHLHGFTDRAHPPTPFVPEPSSPRLAKVAAAVALGAAVGLAGPDVQAQAQPQDHDAIEVRVAPPKPAPPPPDNPKRPKDKNKNKNKGKHKGSGKTGSQ